ncbi:hypothetical protein FACS1894184_19330 [Clostridia bacterium]|nr:hypothetical protein FACS1894184_19330 [Clostridia bacterium]
MGRLSSTQAESLPASEFALSETIRRVKFLASQLRGLDAPRLIQVKVPSGGTLQWEISNGTDRPDYAAEIEGVIAAYDARNAYWLKPYGDGPKESPTCSSDNGVWGTDTDGNEFRCADCPRNVIGTDAKGRGKACKNMVRLLVLRETDALPLELILPAMSRENYSAYLSRLSSMHLKASGVVTRITLAKAVNRDGTDYSRAQFKADGTVDADLAAELQRCMAQIALPAAEIERLDDGEANAASTKTLEPDSDSQKNTPAAQPENDKDDVPFE